MPHNDSVAHLIGNNATGKPLPKHPTKKHYANLEVNGNNALYLKEGEVMTSGDVQSVMQHIRDVEFEGAKAKGFDTDDLERPRGLGVRTASEDFVAGDED